MNEEIRNEEVMKDANPVEVVSLTTPENVTPKKARKPKAPKARNVEELVHEATKKMTDKEKDILIEYLREEILKKDTQIEFHKSNTQAALEKAQLAERQFATMEAYYADRQEYITDQVKAFANAVLLATKGKIK